MILIWTESWIKLSSYKNSFLTVIFLLFSFSTGNVSASVMEDIFAGRIGNTYSVPTKALLIPKKGDQEGYVNLQETLFLLGEEAAVFGNFELLDKVYITIDQLLDYDLAEQYFSGNVSTGDWVAMKLALMNDSLSLVDPRFTPEQKLQTIDSFKNIQPNAYLNDGQLISFYMRVVDFYISQDDYKQAEIYALIGLATASSQKRLFTNDIVKLLSRLFFIQAHFGKRQNLIHLANLFDEIISEYPWSEAQGSNLLSYSMLMTAAVELGSFDYAKLLKTVIQTMESQGVNIPETVQFSVAANDLIMKAWSGEKVNSKYFDTELSLEQKSIPQVFHLLNALEVFSKVNNSQKIKNSDLEKLKAAAEFWPENYTVFEKIVFLEYSSQNGNVKEFEQNLIALRDFYFQYQSRKISYFEYDKSPGFIDKQIKKSVFRSLKAVYPDIIPENIAELILEIVTPVSSEVDFQIKAKNASISAPNLIISPQTGLKLRKEFDYLLLSLLEPLKDNFFAFAGNNYTAQDGPEASNLGFGFTDMLNGLKQRGEKSISSKDLIEIVNPKPIDTNELKSILSRGQVLVTYQIVEKTIFICHLRNISTNCKIKALEQELSELSKKLRNDLLQSDRNVAFHSSAQTELYKIFFDEFAIEDIFEVKFHPLPTDIGLPFNLLKLNKKNSLPIGLNWGIEIVPSLVVLKSTSDERVYKGTYLGVGDPQFKSSKNAETEMASFFTVRSAAMASDLLDLSQLPDTRDEIINSSMSFETDSTQVFLGEDATELNLRLNSPQDYKFLHFATHGLVSGEFEGLRSPGLALSVNPSKINALNDGYFDLFEISELDFQTEVVVLSACRTVSDLGNPNAGFSGLASAFLNAGVRGVLGTQWEIESVSASKIISDFFSVLSEQNSLDASLALKQVMNNAVINGYSHPYYWSPFVYVSALTKSHSRKARSIFREDSALFAHYETDERLEFTGLNSFEGDVWGTFWKTKFEANGFATNYIFKLRDNEVIPIKTPFGSVKIIKQSKNKIIFSASYKEGTRTLPGIFEFEKEKETFSKMLDFENEISSEEIAIIKDFIPLKEGYLITVEGHSKVNSKNEIERTLWSLFEINSDFKKVQSKSILDMLDDSTFFQDNLLLSNGVPYIGFTKFPFHDGKYDFSKNAFQCSSYSIDFYKITDNLGLSKHNNKNGYLSNVETDDGNSLLTVFDHCSGLSQFITLDGKTNLTFPNYAVQAVAARLIDFKGENFIVGNGSYRSSYLDQMFNYKPISEQTDINAFWENRDYMISEDSGSFIFIGPVEKNIVGEKLSFKTSRMTSFISAAAVSGEELFLAGTIDRDRAVIWKLSSSEQER